MINLISFILVIVGALNWLSLGLFEFDFVAAIFGSQADTVSRIIYGLVGLAALILLYAAIKTRGHLNVSGEHHADEELIDMHESHDIHKPRT
jgi:uncharacterized protein